MLSVEGMAQTWNLKIGHAADGPCVVGRAGPDGFQIIERPYGVARPGQAIPLDGRPSLSDRPDVRRAAAVHAQQDVRQAGILRVPRRATPVVTVHGSGGLGDGHHNGAIRQQ